MSREYPARPYCCLCAVVWRDDEFLLIKRGKEPSKGDWYLPGGAQSLGETAEIGVRREVLEETDITAEVGPLIDLIEVIEEDDASKTRFHFSILVFVARYVNGTLQAGDDAEDAKWIAYADLYSLDLSEGTVQAVEKSRAHRTF
ncbi:NUDIX hydrolase [Sneathiella limimaris]|uniref:NUDIX hydrolase n=1 Tax=Sneathiella limimaris TaxID=1964213 RepID=UPI00146D601F|nr:NUDIX hydrolase [Sneathiella limimaris]